MCEKIFLRELECYKRADEMMKKHPLYSPDRYFDLGRIDAAGFRIQLEEFIRSRGTKISPLSMRSEIYPFNLLCDFLNDSMSEFDTFSECSEEDVEKRAKKWLLKHGKSPTQTRRRTATGKTGVVDSDLVTYIRKLYKFLRPENKSFSWKSDKWYLDNIPIKIKVNPTKTVESLSFKGISQPTIKDEVKKVIYIHLTDLALGTILAEMTAINRFSTFLESHYPAVRSLHDVDREVIEHYLVHTNTEAAGRKSYSKELCHLKSILITAGKILEDKDLQCVFFRDDIGKAPQKLYKVYSDTELNRLNESIVSMDIQVARALFLHQMLGTRISETLSLRKDAIFKGKNGKAFIRIFQIKSGKTYIKPVSDDIKNLFEAACKYTDKKYGDTNYVFVSEKDSAKPMQYSRIQYQIMAMIRKKDLRDDQGELFGVGTHIWRHCYGKRLTEMHVDDVTIAKLMGHADTSSLKYYRRIGNKMLADETRDVRESMDGMMRKYLLNDRRNEDAVKF